MWEVEDGEGDVGDNFKGEEEMEEGKEEEEEAEEEGGGFVKCQFLAGFSVGAVEVL